jgi:hypothetical protein
MWNGPTDAGSGGVYESAPLSCCGGGESGRMQGVRVAIMAAGPMHRRGGEVWDSRAAAAAEGW